MRAEGRRLTAPQPGLTYVGEPTILIGLDGVRFLTDPTFDPAGSSSTSPAGVTLAKTMGPALAAESLGHIDAVLLSHDHHFDNLDRSGRTLPKAIVVPVHYEGWKHFSESREDIRRAFAAAGLESRLHW